MTDEPRYDEPNAVGPAPRGIVGARELFDQARRRYRHRRISAGAVSAVACVAVAAIGFAALNRSQPLKFETTSPSTSVSSAAAPTSTRPVARMHPAAPVVVGLNPIELASDGSGIWVGNLNDKSLSRIDGATHAVTTIALQCEPRGVAAAAGSIWVTCQDTKTVVQINATTERIVTHIAGGDLPGEIASAGDTLWVTDRSGAAVRRIDARTATVAATISIGNHLLPISATADAVWVADEAGDSVYRIDPATNTVTNTITETGAVSNLLATAERVYVSKNDGTIDAIDTTTNRIVARSAVLASGNSVQALDGMALLDGTLYVAAPKLGVLAVDPATLALEYRIAGEENFHYLTAAGKSLFVPDEGRNTVTVLTAD